MINNKKLQNGCLNVTNLPGLWTSFIESSVLYQVCEDMTITVYDAFLTFYEALCMYQALCYALTF